MDENHSILTGKVILVFFHGKVVEGLWLIGSGYLPDDFETLNKMEHPLDFFAIRHFIELSKHFHENRFRNPSPSVPLAKGYFFVFDYGQDLSAVRFELNAVL